MSTVGIREWARANGFTVAARGRISPEIHAAYRRAGHAAEHPQLPPTYASCKCGRRWTGVSQCHCTVCHEHFSSVRWFDQHRRNMDATNCHDPATLKGPQLKKTEDAWGPVWVRADSLDVTAFDRDQEPVLL